MITHEPRRRLARPTAAERRRYLELQRLRAEATEEDDQDLLEEVLNLGRGVLDRLPRKPGELRVIRWEERG